METGYEIEPRPIGRSSRRRLPVVVGAVGVLLAIVIAKPWAGGVGPPAANLAGPSAVSPSALPALAAGPAAADADAVPTWPAASIAADVAAAAASRAEGALGQLAARSGTWGVGGVGVGPRILRDEVWTDWAAVNPEASGDTPANIAIWPHTGLCTGFQTIYDHPSIVAVTAPADLAPDWRLVGWWTDGGHVANLEGSIRQISPAGNRGVSYLERTDRAPWPPGRYEFHVVTGGSAVELTVCITRRG